MKRISIFNPPIQNINKSYPLTLPQLFNKIKNDEEIKNLISMLRSYNDKKSRDQYKIKRLEAITFSGEFSQRKAEGLIIHSGIICVDIDNLDKAQMEIVIIALCLLKKFLVGYFVSPSATGYKILLHINHGLYTQAENYVAAVNFLHAHMNIPKDKFDRSCKDIARACFISSDTNAYLNELAYSDESFVEIPLVDNTKYGILKPMEIEEEFSNLGNQNPIIYNPLLRDASLDFNKKDDSKNFSILLSKTTQAKGKYKIGNRHNYIQVLSSYLNQFGMSKDASLIYCIDYFRSVVESKNEGENFESEIILIIEDTYVRYKEQHSQWSEEDGEKEMETPLFPESLKTSLPFLIAEPMRLFKGREADVFLCGILGVLSSWMPKVGGIYDGKLLSANLFFMISAPASAGKGILMWARKLTNQIVEDLRYKFEKAKEQYERILKKYEEDKKEGIESTKPEKPLKEKFIVAGNISSAALISSLAINKCFGLIIESEADTLVNTLNNSTWGGFSDIIRKSFHNESISYSRKKDDEDIEIIKSYLSIVLSGTPQQISKLVSSIENGLFSRILFYSFPNNNVWKDIFEEKEKNLEKYFEGHGIKLEKYLRHFFYDKSNNNDDIILFDFTSVQKAKFNAWFEMKQTDLSQIYGDDIIASVRRLGVCFFRIAMILSVLRLIENNDYDEYVYKRAVDIKCSNDDYQNAELIIDTLIFHTINIYKQVKKTNRNKYNKGKKLILLENLPVEFNRAKAMELAAYIGIKEKTAENYITQFINQQLLVRIEHNHYKKICVGS
jgi:hypothetical protein